MVTKVEMIDRLSIELEVSKSYAGKIYQVLSDINIGLLVIQGKLLIPGVGRLRLKDKPTRMGRNPRTGEQVIIPERRVIKLSPSKLTKIRVNIKK